MKRYCLSTMYGVGLIGIAPGTFGSIVAVLIAYPILAFVPHGYVWLLVGAAVLTLVGTWHASRFMRDRNTAHDPKEIVIDELVGQWLTYVVWFAWMALMSPNTAAAVRLLDSVASSPMYLALGFVLFRFFDIVKPWPISRVDRRIKGGLGVMIDDVVAAIPAGLLLALAHIYSPLLSGTLQVRP